MLCPLFLYPLHLQQLISPCGVVPSGCCATSEAKATCVCELDCILNRVWMTAAVFADKMAPSNAIAARLGIVEETHNTCVPSCAELSLG